MTAVPLKPITCIAVWKEFSPCTPTLIARVTTGTTYTNDGTESGTDDDVTTGVTYRYAVAAYRAVVGDWSNEVTATARTPTAPGAPGTLEGQATAAKVVLTWAAPGSDGGSALTAYTLYRGTGNACTGLSVLQSGLPTTGTTYTDSSVTGGTIYCYQVSASNSAGEGVKSGSTVVTAVTVGAPTGLTVTAEGDSSISLAWTAPAVDGGGAIEAYNVYRCVEGDSPCTPTWIARVTTGTTYTNDGTESGTDDDVTTGVTYRYAVAAYRAVVGDWSNEVTATARTPTAPGAPGTLEGQATAAKVVLTWAAPGSDGGSALTAYTLYRGTGNACTGLSVLQSGLSTTGTTYTDSSVTGGTTYCYQVSASNSAGEGMKSGSTVVTAVTVGAPTGLTVTAEGDSSISLAWTAPADDGGGAIEAYNVYRCVEGDSPCTPTWIARVTTGTTYTNDGTESGTDDDVTTGVTYRYAVAASRAVVGDWSNAVTATARTPTAPGAPGTLEGQATAAKVVLTWAAPGSDGGSALTAYTLYRGTGNACTGLSVLQSGLSTTGTTYTDSSVTGGTTYCYQVSASNSAGEGVKSGSTVVTAVTVGAPTGLTVTAEGDSSISLAWTAPADDGGGAIEAYNVYRCVEGDSPCTPTWIARVTTGTTYTNDGTESGTDDDVTTGVTYRYAVAASRAVVGDWSNAVTATARTPTAPGAPGTLEGQATAAKVVLTWAAPGSDGGSALTAYTLYRGTGNACTGLSVLQSGLSTTGTTYTDSSVTGGTTYCYQVSASNSAGEGVKSGSTVVTAVTVGAPTGLTVTAEGDSSISLAWTAPADDGGGAIEAYNVYRCVEGDSPCTPTWIARVTTGTTYTNDGTESGTDDDVTTGVTYRYAVAASRAVVGDWSNAVTATARTPTAPGAPGTLEGQATAAKVVLTWAAPGSDGGSALTAYTLYRGTGNACTGLSVLQSGLSTTGTTYTDSSVTGGTTYCYQVSASNSAGEGVKSGSTVVTAVTVGAPTGLTVTAEGDSSISLAWTAPADDGGGAIEAYNVYRCVEGDSPCTPTWIARVTTGTTYTNDGTESGTDDDVTTGVTYRYAVAASRAVVGDWSNAVTATARTPTAPGAPGTLEGQATAAKVVLTWAAPGSDGGSALTAYTLYRGTGNACTGLSVLQSGLSTTGTTYTDSSVTGGTTYCYQVSASNSAGEGVKSGSTVVTAVTVGAPTGLTVTAEGDSSISLAWTAPADDGGGAIEAYNVYRCVEGDSPCTPTWIARVTTGTTYTNDGTESGTDDDVTTGVTYRYAVAASRAVVGDWSNAVTATARTPTAPGAPGTLEGQATAAKVVLTWAAPGSDGGSALTAYTLYRGTGNACTGLSVLQSGLSTTGTTYTDSSVTGGTTYCYQVSASNSAGEGVKSGSTVVTAVTVGAPTGLTVTAEGDSSISLAWTAPADDGGGAIEAYNVYRCVEGDSPCTPTWIARVTTGTTYTNDGTESGTDDDVTTGVTYRYAVAASRAVVGDWSNAVTATARTPTAPGAPGTLEGQATAAKVVLTWAAPGSDGGSALTAYTLYRGTGNACTGLSVLQSGLSTTGTTYTDSSVTGGTTYCYQVSASNSAGEGVKSGSTVVTAVTVGAPTGLTVTAEGDSSISLAWTAPADDGGGAIEAYNVYRCVEGDSPCTPTWIARVTTGTTYTNDGTESGTDDDVTTGVTYRYAVAASRAVVGDWSNAVTATARTPTAPGAPGTLEGQATAAKVVLTWAAYRGVTVAVP